MAITYTSKLNQPILKLFWCYKLQKKKKIEDTHFFILAAFPNRIWFENKEAILLF